MVSKKYTSGHMLFTNQDCEYFPCHEIEQPDDFNCLFCFCPLYPLGENCGGIFSYTNGIKDCSACSRPHRPENYQEILNECEKLYDNMKIPEQRKLGKLNEKN